MIYTLGNGPPYRRNLAKGPSVKLGRTATYAGGAVWQSPGEVFFHISENQPRLKGYAVFAVDADWHSDVAPNILGKPWHDLLVDAPILHECHHAASSQ